jgi:hypothetical protein
MATMKHPGTPVISRRLLFLIAAITLQVIVIKVVIRGAPVLVNKVITTKIFPSKRIQKRDYELELETRANRSSWSVLTVNNSVGKPLYILLNARDVNGNSKHTGEDFFNAILITRTPQRTSIYGKVEDLHNGSYLITFVPRSSGQASVSIKLWLTSRLVKLVRTKKTTDYIFSCAFGKDHGQRMIYSEGKHRLILLQYMRRNELRECRMDWHPDLLPRSNKSCDMTFPWKYHWYGVCEGPRARNSTKCDDLKWCISHDKMMNQSLQEQQLITEKNLMVRGSVRYVMISDTDDDDTIIKKPCRPQPLVRARGHWLGTKWVNWDCSLGSVHDQVWRRCLANKRLYFIGDSTVRQLYLSVRDSFGFPRIYSRDEVTHELKTTYIKLHNTTIRYDQHGLPWLTPNGINFTSVDFTTDLLDAIPAHGNEIIILSTIHHFVLMPPEGFRLRLQQIIDALRRMRNRRKGRRIPVVFRTANPRQFSSLSLNAYKIKWYNEVAVEMFVKSELDVVVYDVFDMIASGGNPEGLHQSDFVISIQLSHIFGLLCPDIH